LFSILLVTSVQISNKFAVKLFSVEPATDREEASTRPVCLLFSDVHGGIS
jgi:hypothetical protein